MLKMIIEEISEMSEGDINKIYEYVLENAPEAYAFLVMSSDMVDVPITAVAVAIAIREQSKKIRSLEPSLN
jgi:hypothetical protein